MLVPSAHTPWYRGPQLVPYLEGIEVATDISTRPLRFPVQWVNRPDLDFRGFAGTIAAGTVHVGDEVLVAASRKPARVSRIVTMDGDLAEAVAGEAVTLVLDREVDISRGDVLVHPGETPEFSNQFQARMIWMQEERAAFPGRSYLLKLGTQLVPASITDLKFRTNVNTLEKSPARSLELNEVGTVAIATDKSISFDAFTDGGQTGALHPHRPPVECDRVGAGVIDFLGLRRGTKSFLSRVLT